jgi:hypothetical protein
MKKLTTSPQKQIIFIFPIIYIILFLSIKIALPNTYTLIVQEDSIIEYIQAFLYFISSILALIISTRFISNRFIMHGTLYLILFAGLLFVSIEEISWGQRIFNIETPQYLNKINSQNEITIHNLKPVQAHLQKAYILIGLYGTFGCLFMCNIKTKSDNIINYVIPEWFISPYFFAVLLVYAYFSFISPFGVNTLGIDKFKVGAFVIWRDQEPAELLLSLGFFIFTISNNIKSKIMCQTLLSNRVEL